MAPRPPRRKSKPPLPVAGPSFEEALRVAGRSGVQAALDAFELSEERITLELARLGFYNIQDAVDPDGDVKPVQHLSRDLAAALTTIEQSTRTIEREGEDGRVESVTTTRRKYAFAEKRAALDLLGRRYDAFKGVEQPRSKQELRDAVEAELHEIFGSVLARRGKTIEGKGVKA